VAAERIDRAHLGATCLICAARRVVARQTTASDSSARVFFIEADLEQAHIEQVGVAVAVEVGTLTRGVLQRDPWPLQARPHASKVLKINPSVRLAITQDQQHG
jgi:hypothetical protein